jgi:TetR/AcrR family transcriptional repressor of multidrug resistance operon
MSPTGNDKRKLILDATEKLVAKEGFHGFSMQKLANEAGVAAGTIYRYFEDKEHLIEETRLHVTQRTADIIQAGVQNDMSLKEQYRTLWLNIWNFAKTKSAVQSHMLYEQLITKDERVFQREAEMFYKIERLLEEGKSQGLFKPLDNKLLVSVSLESSSALARRAKNNCIQIDDKVLEQAIDASWDALINH